MAAQTSRMDSVALSRVSEAPATTLKKAMEILVDCGQGEAVIAALDEAQQSQQADDNLARLQKVVDDAADRLSGRAPLVEGVAQRIKRQWRISEVGPRAEAGRGVQLGAKRSAADASGAAQHESTGHQGSIVVAEAAQRWTDVTS